MYVYSNQREFLCSKKNINNDKRSVRVHTEGLDGKTSFFFFINHIHHFTVISMDSNNIITVCTDRKLQLVLDHTLHITLYNYRYDSNNVSVNKELNSSFCSNPNVPYLIY